MCTLLFSVNFTPLSPLNGSKSVKAPLGKLHKKKLKKIKRITLLAENNKSTLYFFLHIHVWLRYIIQNIISNIVLCFIYGVSILVK